jgi:metal iron transporter
MNCPSRNDDVDKHPGWNQTPPALVADLTTRADLNGISNLREQHEGDSKQSDVRELSGANNEEVAEADGSARAPQKLALDKHASTIAGNVPHRGSGKGVLLNQISQRVRRLQEILFKYAQFIGPGFLIAVAYIDPGNYATDVNGTQP